MKKIVVTWSPAKKKIVGMAHNGCCKQDGGGCPKKHG